MSKMTTEQFLSHLGIEVGKVYKAGGVEFKVCSSPVWSLLYENENGLVVSTNNFSWLLNREITPLPKYTLTDDEKSIVRNLFEDMDVIGVDANGSLYVRNKFAIPTWLPFYNVFRFIKLDTEVSLDELRRCL